MTDDQAKDAFAELLANEADWAAQAIENAPKQELPPVKHNGLSYTGDSVSTAGEARSTYTFTYEGKRLFDVHVDLTEELTPVPHGAVAVHPIRIVSLDAKTSISTKGKAIVAKHEDSNLVHVDGTSVLHYVAPRALRYVVMLYVK